MAEPRTRESPHRSFTAALQPPAEPADALAPSGAGPLAKLGVPFWVLGCDMGFVVVGEARVGTFGGVLAGAGAGPDLSRR